jgi:metal-sulfur cluster biosynthetic enzyme|tara:strand:+ start:204 stop:563 length:360 start_codon:yes stop_codon:yes gene_type:complete
MAVREEIVEVLKKCYDPEIPIDLWNLGLIYDIDIKENENHHKIKIIMSLTTPGCSMGGQMAEDIKKKISSLKNISDVGVEVTFDPPWKPEMMTDFARKKLGFEPVIAQKKENKVDLEWE